MEVENSEALIDAPGAEDALSPPAEVDTVEMEAAPAEVNSMEMEPAADDEFQAMEEPAPPQLLRRQTTTFAAYR